MKLLKHISALFFSLVIVTNLYVCSVSATEATIVDDQNSIIQKLEAFGVLKAPENPEAIVKREDIIPIMAECNGLKGLVAADTSVSPFVDVSVNDEYISEYNYLYETGYIKGCDGRCFHPQREISIEEAATFIVRLYDYDVLKNENFSAMAIAMEMQLFEGVDSDADGSLTYSDLYTMIYNALFVAPIEFENDSMKINSDTSILNEKYGIYYVDDIVNATSATGLLTASDNVPEGYIKIGGASYECIDNKYSSFIGKRVLAYYKETDMSTKEIVYLEEYKNEILVVDAEDVDVNKTTDTKLYYLQNDEKEKSVKLETGTAVIYNKVAYSGYGAITNIFPDSGKIELIDNNHNGFYDVINVTAYENYVVGYIDVPNETIIEKVSGNKIVLNSDDNNIVIYDAGTGSEVEFKQIEENDVLTVEQSKNTTGRKQIVVYIVRSVIEGAISSSRQSYGDTIYTINGIDYTVAQNFENYIASGCETELALGTELRYYLDYTGKIAAVERGIVSDDYLFGVTSMLIWDPSEEIMFLTIFNQNGEWIKAPLNSRIVLDGIKIDVLKTEDRQKINDAVKPQEVIRYKYSGEAFTHIDTENYNASNTSKESDRGNLTLLAAGTQFNQRFNMCSDNTDISSSWFVKQNDVVVFKVPQLINIKDKELYSVENKISTHFYSPTAGNYTTVVKEGYKVFVTSIDDINTAECILLKGCDAAVAIESSSRYYLVRNIYEGINQNEEVCPILSLVYNGTEAEYYVNPTSFAKIEYNYGAGSSSNNRVYSSTPATIESLHLERGDVVQISTDATNSVVGLCIVHRNNPEKATVYQQFSTWDANFHWEESAASGTLISVDTTNKIVKFSCTHRMARKAVTIDNVTYPAETRYELPLTYQSSASSAKITIYDKYNNTFSTGTLASLIPGDKLILNLNYADSIREIIVIRE